MRRSAGHGGIVAAAQGKRQLENRGRSCLLAKPEGIAQYQAHKKEPHGKEVACMTGKYQYPKEAS
ncbi:MAG TPA: hypothetical protein ENJ79_03170 [Gammaproteobacteria bacterium]|nr:hypothetical protein [Gammaproteobacteria bacterium]